MATFTEAAIRARAQAESKLPSIMSGEKATMIKKCDRPPESLHTTCLLTSTKYSFGVISRHVHAEFLPRLQLGRT